MNNYRILLFTVLIFFNAVSIYSAPPIEEVVKLCKKLQSINIEINNIVNASKTRLLLTNEKPKVRKAFFFLRGIDQKIGLNIFTLYTWLPTNKQERGWDIAKDLTTRDFIKNNAFIENWKTLKREINSIELIRRGEMLYKTCIQKGKLYKVLHFMQPDGKIYLNINTKYSPLSKEKMDKQNQELVKIHEKIESICSARSLARLTRSLEYSYDDTILITFDELDRQKSLEVLELFSWIPVNKRKAALKLIEPVIIQDILNAQHCLKHWNYISKKRFISYMIKDGNDLAMLGRRKISLLCEILTLYREKYN